LVELPYVKSNNQVTRKYFNLFFDERDILILMATRIEWFEIRLMKYR